MAANTDNDALTASAYTLLATDAATGMVQHMSGGLVRIHVGSALPDADTADYILIGSVGDLPRVYQWSGFTTGDDVYGRADRDSAVVSTIASA